MCIPHIRVGSYAHELECGMSAQIENLLHGRFLIPLGLFVCFFIQDAIYLFERERSEKHVLEGQKEREKQDPC